MSNNTPKAYWDEVQIGHVEPNRFAIDLMADTIAEQINEGHVDVLKATVQLKAMEEMCKTTRERVEGSIRAELEKHPKGKAEVFGAQITTVDTPRYDYSDEPGWSEIEEQIVALKEKQKEIEDNAKKWHKGDLPVKSVISSIKIQLAK